MEHKPKKAPNVLLLSTIVLVLMMLSALPMVTVSGSGEADTVDKHQRAPLNSDNRDYIEDPSPTSYGYIPPPMDLGHLRSIPVHNQLQAGSLPGAFDWRDLGKVTPVKNQRPCGTCWIFGTIAAIESRVMVVEGTEYDFSEQNTLCCTDPSWVYLNDFFSDRCSAGGWDWLAIDVLAKKGTKLESCDPYDASPISTATCNDACTPIKRITGYRLVTNSPDDIAAVKEAIYTYGPVSMAYCHDSSHMYPGNIYYWPDCSVGANHLVCIVGWDDTIAHPDGGGYGAWIVKNSWGTDWGNDGYFYFCYGSANMQEVASYRYEDYNPNEMVYYWDEAGIVTATGWADSSSAWMASVFTAQQSGNLTSVDFWTTSNNAQYELYVYDGSFGTQLASQSGNCSEFGYYSIPLDGPIATTAGQQFTVAVKMTTPGYDYPLPIEAQKLDWVDPPIQNGVCFERHLDSDPWQDAGATWGENVCLRAKIVASAAPTPTPTPTPQVTPTPAISLGEAVDNEALSWTTGYDFSWFGQTETYYYGGDAAQSGHITHDQYSWLRTTVNGPGTLTFYWKVSCEVGMLPYDSLEFDIDKSYQKEIWGSIDWQQESYYIGAGVHTVGWIYSKDSSVSSGSDCGWLDKVEFTPTPTPTPTPAFATPVTGITREVNGNILPGVSITLDGIETVVSDQDGYYEIMATTTGNHTLVAHMDGFRDRTQTISIAGLGPGYAVTCNFQSASGLIPNAPDMRYALDCVNRWLYPPNPDIGLDIWSALDVINAWLYPVQ